MRLHLLRHAEAVDNSDDDARVLSAFGRRSLEPLAAQVKAMNLMGREVELWHSPLLRAVETAQLFAPRAGLTSRLKMRPGLRPEDDPAELIPVLTGRADDLLIVGHEPFLSTLATRLLVGAPYPPRVVMEKAALLCLERFGLGDYVAWCVRWHLPGADGEMR